MLGRRQAIIVGALGAVAPRLVLAQARPRIGVLLLGSGSVALPHLIQSLSDLGYRDGVGATIDVRRADDRPDRLSDLAKQLVGARCRLVYTVGDELGILALRKVDASIPIVFVAISFDPLEKGIVRSLARPGGNITGVYLPLSSTSSKRLELATQILPEVKRFLVLSDEFAQGQLVAVERAARSLGVELTVVRFDKQPYDIEAAFARGKKEGARAVMVLTSLHLVLSHKRIAAEARKHRAPAFGPRAETGWLASYTIQDPIYMRRAAHLGAQILQGANAGELPVEQPSEYEVIVNLRHAKELGITVPASVLVRATKIIE